MLQNGTDAAVFPGWLVIELCLDHALRCSWLLGVCATISTSQCHTVGCDPVFSAGQHRLVRTDSNGVPQMQCWTRSLAQWLSASGMPSFDSIPDGDAAQTIFDFLEAFPDFQADVLLTGQPGTTSLQLVSATFRFESTFVLSLIHI